jgi:hypothetical protein
MFFFKSKKRKKTENRIILAMLMLNKSESFDLLSFLSDLKDHTNYKPRKVIGDNAAVTFEVEDELVGIGSMSMPVPGEEIRRTAEYAYNWDTAAEDLKDHKGHLIVSITRGSDDMIKRHGILTSVICSLLRTNDAIGVYKGSQSLLVPKKDYLTEAERMSDDYYPLNLWIYFGLTMENGKVNGYTYGLKEFDKREIEIIDSEKSVEQVRSFLFNMAHYVLEHDVTFQHGQTCGMSATEKITITLSPGRYIKEDTFKMAY